MSDNSKIEWCDASWNPVSCKNCFAERFAERFRGVKGHPFEQGFDVRLVPEALDLPLRWRKPRRVFVNSMSDLFHPDVPDAFIAAVFGVMSLCGRHQFQLLTKRPERMLEWISRATLADCQAEACVQGVDIVSERRRTERADEKSINGPWPLPNVMLGVSVEDQRAADERIPTLLQTLAAVRFVSCEPLIAPVNLLHPMWMLGPPTQAHGMHQGLDWVIIGGENGPGARPCDVAWIRSLVEQCKAARVPVFVKQLGAAPRGLCSWRHHDRFPPEWLDEDGVLPAVSGRPAYDLCHANLDGWWPCASKLRDRKGGDMSEFPEDLRIREMPEVQR